MLTQLVIVTLVFTVPANIPAMDSPVAIAGRHDPVWRDGNLVGARTDQAGVEARPRLRVSGVLIVHGIALLGGPRLAHGQTAQRAATLVRPDWNWLQAITRLITNSSTIVLLYPFALSFPYVLVATTAPDPQKAETLALRVNSTIWWVTMGTMSIYWLINTVYQLWVCAQFLRYAGRRRAEQFS